MIDLNAVSEILGYSAGGENWIRLRDSGHDPAMAYLYRRAKEAGAEYAYVFQTCSKEMPVLPARAAVYFASAESEMQADELHRRLWLIGNAPFIIVVLPDHARVYTGFNYRRGDQQVNDNIGIIQSPVPLNEIAERLSDFQAQQIDSGHIWKQQEKHLRAVNRVDSRLLKNLEQLGNDLVDEERFGNNKLSTQVAHNLIGKYLYIHYLKDRDILSSEWMKQRTISEIDVYGRNATTNGLLRLTEALEIRFNGGVFPLALSGPNAPANDVVAYVAGVIAGDETYGQLALDFQIYDFSYIPVELLSSIYEQFLRRQETVRNIGAYYTPEPVADYLVSELNYVKPLKQGMRVMDPCCGSGVFLVLAYRRLIELARAKKEDGLLTPDELSTILLESIYGVERNEDACYVTEFSLILTLLSYVEPPELDRHENFKFPPLHNERIFCCDFFNEDTPFWNQNLHFDWIIGNPPWVELPKASQTGNDRDAPVREWIQKANNNGRPVARGRVSDAFCWRVVDALAEGGRVGLLIPAKTLTNEQCKPFRAAFFTQNTTFRITNFSNLAYVLFAGRAEHPAATIIYTRKWENEQQPKIVHYGPFIVNQKTECSNTSRNEQVWTITISENEIQVIEPSDAATGEHIIWKMALWGNRRDRRILPRLNRIFPQTLKELCNELNWSLEAGIQLSSGGEFLELPELVLNPSKMTASRFHFNVPSQALDVLPKENAFIRLRGGREGLKIINAPHVFFSINFAAFSNVTYVLTNPHIGISATIEDEDYLLAISVLLMSSIIRYALFFQSHSWGIDKSIIRLREVEQLHIPKLDSKQISSLANLQRFLSERESQEAQQIVPPTDLFNNEKTAHRVVPKQVSNYLQIHLDNQVERILNIPEYIRIAVHDFIEVRYQFIKGKRGEGALNEPSDQDLLEYGQKLAHELDAFVGVRDRRHKITLIKMDQMIVCQVEYVEVSAPVEATIIEANGEKYAPYLEVWRSLKKHFSQWVYVQRSLRWFDGETVWLFKPARFMDWTLMQAQLDSDDIIGEILSSGMERK